MHKNFHENRLKDKRQQGAATLIVTVILLIGVTLIAIYATKVGILDQKISGNEYRHKQAFASAEAGLEQAASFLRSDQDLHDTSTTGWSPCTGLTAVFPCDLTGAEFVYATVAASTITPSIPSVLAASQSYFVKRGDNTIVVGVGTSDDNTGAAVVQTEYASLSLLTPGELPPLMAPETDLSGSFTIVPNPNGGGDGVPVSAWVKTKVTSGGAASWQTCNHGEFLDGPSGPVCMDTKDDTTTWKACACSDNLSEPGNEGSDLVLNDPDFPASPFDFMFDGKSREDVMELAATDGALIDGDCSTSTLNGSTPGNTLVNGVPLSSLKIPLVWVTGDCDFSSGDIIGSRTTPIILIVEGLVKANGTFDLWGVLFGWGVVSLNGTTVIHGSTVAETATNLTNGGFSQVYDQGVFEQLVEDTTAIDIAKVKYSWRDFTP